MAVVATADRDDIAAPGNGGGVVFALGRGQWRQGGKGQGNKKNAAHAFLRSELNGDGMVLSYRHVLTASRSHAEIEWRGF
jgi:hypothetical protein